MLDDGFIQRICSGKRIDIWNDKWLPMLFNLWVQSLGR